MLSFLGTKVGIESRGPNPSCTLARQATVYKAHSHKLLTTHLYPGTKSVSQGRLWQNSLTSQKPPSFLYLWFPINPILHLIPVLRTGPNQKPYIRYPGLSAMCFLSWFPHWTYWGIKTGRVTWACKIFRSSFYFCWRWSCSALNSMFVIVSWAQKKGARLLRSPNSRHSSASGKCFHYKRLPLGNLKTIMEGCGLYLQTLHCLLNQHSCFQISTCQSKPWNVWHDWAYWYFGIWLRQTLHSLAGLDLSWFISKPASIIAFI